MKPLQSIAAVFAVVVGMVACGASRPSPELLSARQAYASAEKTAAAEFAQDSLLEARQALNRAEREHKKDGGGMTERTLAYVAERLAKLAVAQANRMAAQREEEEAAREFSDELERAQRRTQGALNTTRDSLGRTKADLERAQTDLERQQAELAARKAALEAREKELAKSNEALERERQARLAAEEKAAKALKSLEEIAAVKQEKRGMVITLSGQVLFQTGVASLLPVARQKLRQVAIALAAQDKDKRIIVEGHTDSRGSNASNRELSRERAESVRSFLVGEGVAAEKISAIGKGEDEPVTSNRTAEGRANNRRVEIIIR